MLRSYPFDLDIRHNFYTFKLISNVLYAILNCNKTHAASIGFLNVVPKPPHRSPNHRGLDCLFNSFAMLVTTEIRAPITGPIWGESTGDGEFPSQMVSNSKCVSISWCHDVNIGFNCIIEYIIVEIIKLQLFFWCEYIDSIISFCKMSSYSFRITYWRKHQYIIIIDIKSCTIWIFISWSNEHNTVTFLMFQAFYTATLDFAIQVSSRYRMLDEISWYCIKHGRRNQT